MKMNLLALFLLLAIWVVGYEAYQDSKDSTVSEWTNTVKLQRDPHGAVLESAALAAYLTYLAREREAKKYGKYTFSLILTLYTLFVRKNI